MPFIGQLHYDELQNGYFTAHTVNRTIGLLQEFCDNRLITPNKL